MQNEVKDAKKVVLKVYKGWVLGSIGRTYEATRGEADGSTPLAAFILTSCAIDFLAGFLCGLDSFENTRNNATNYKNFLSRYMIQYAPEDIYKHIRCRLAHNYTITGGIRLTHEHPEIHDPTGSSGHKIINFEDFFSDFQSAADRYFADLENDTGLQANFFKRYKLGIPGTIPI